MGKSPIPKTRLCNVFYMLGYRWAFYQRFILYQFTLMLFLLKRMPRVKCRGTISKQIPNSLDRVDQQDFVICCRIYSNSKIWDPNQYWVVIFQVLDLYEAWYIYLRLKLDLLSMILYKKTIIKQKKVLRQLLFMFSSVLTQIWKSCYFFFALSSTLVERRWWYLQRYFDTQVKPYMRVNENFIEDLQCEQFLLAQLFCSYFFESFSFWHMP